MDCVPAEVDDRGFATVRSACSLLECLDVLGHLAATTPRSGRRGGSRVPMAGHPAIRQFATKSVMQVVAANILQAAAFPVHAIYFDKTEDANWKVAWHQDLTIAVRARVDTPGFDPWSTKDGIAHVQPPVDVLERMVTIRLHLDDCAESNGPLRVIPASHKAGRLSLEAINAIRNLEPEHLCTAARGDLLALKPLLLHASSAATRPVHRRVLHLEYACDSLPGGLEWFEQCA
jgi:ectoine hydroxylase-related dioxygenase (phytanoyl-CoA dioxygenase family)